MMYSESHRTSMLSHILIPEGFLAEIYDKLLA